MAAAASLLVHAGGALALLAAHTAPGLPPVSAIEVELIAANDAAAGTAAPGHAGSQVPAPPATVTPQLDVARPMTSTADASPMASPTDRAEASLVAPTTTIARQEPATADVARTQPSAVWQPPLPPTRPARAAMPPLQAAASPPAPAAAGSAPTPVQEPTTTPRRPRLQQATAAAGVGGRDGTATAAAAGTAPVPAAGNPPPRYPYLARRRGQQGTVRLDVSVAADGRVSAVRVARSSGHVLLDQAAVRALQRWRFQPATRAGLAVRAQLIVPVRFRLDGSEAAAGTRQAEANR